MCTKLSVIHPKRLQEKLMAKGIEIRNYQANYCADGYDFPLVPALTNAKPDRVVGLEWGLIPADLDLNWERQKFLNGQAEKFAKRGKPFDLSLIKIPDDNALLRTFQSYTLNARAEEVFNKPSWRNSILKRRCIIYADGFFEHQHLDGGKTKIPHYIYTQDNSPLLMGGLWSVWRHPNNYEDVHASCTLITVPANPMMAEIHNSKLRMPLIFDDTQSQQWLQNDLNKEHIIDLMQPCPNNFLAAHTVSKMVSDAQADRNIPSIIDIVPYIPASKNLFAG